MKKEGFETCVRKLSALVEGDDIDDYRRADLITLTLDRKMGTLADARLL